jgi:hypothetical protein
MSSKQDPPSSKNDNPYVKYQEKVMAERKVEEDRKNEERARMRAESEDRRTRESEMHEQVQDLDQTMQRVSLKKVVTGRLDGSKSNIRA